MTGCKLQASVVKVLQAARRLTVVRDKGCGGLPDWGCFHGNFSPPRAKKSQRLNSPPVLFVFPLVSPLRHQNHRNLAVTAASKPGNRTLLAAFEFPDVWNSITATSRTKKISDVPAFSGWLRELVSSANRCILLGGKVNGRGKERMNIDRSSPHRISWLACQRRCL